ncbi:transglutaminase domain-containing protein [Parabacteroides segnis]|uniref:transglutaminase domain-containing protein n=1 Tax=Parabacteroides segnis TaxID=2763058 RepID=UPI0035153122
MAGDNRKELEKVLNYYRDDSEKLTAARFLIENMPGHGGYDSIIVKDMQYVYDQFENISIKYNWEISKQWKSEVKDMWTRNKSEIKLFKYPLMQDVELVQGDWLIRQINMAFCAWKNNAYTKSLSFNDFCKYILPYRVKNELIIEQNREEYSQKNNNYFKSKIFDFNDAIDSLLFQYKYMKYSELIGNSIPLYTAKSFEQIKRGLCEDRTWFNWSLLSASGIPVVIDFVPAWGNRNSSHCWNAFVINGETYPFDPFWDKNRWKYKKLYNNKSFDLNWGKFRLPKVFRYTYEYHLDGPLADKEFISENVPLLFRNIFMEDVSSSYFDAVDIEIDVPDSIIRNDKYCYLCVYQRNNWEPIQWGFIEKNNKVSFKKMGKEIVYITAFYEKQKIQSFGEPFYIDNNGCHKILRCKSEKKNITIRSYTPQIKMEDRISSRKNLEYTYITASNSLHGKQDTIYYLTDSIDVWFNQIHLSNEKLYRYFQFHIPHDTLGLCEVIYYEKGSSAPVSDVKVIADVKKIKQKEELVDICDGLSATGFKGIFKQNSDLKNTVIFDLGKDLNISSIVYIPYTKSSLNNNKLFELQYFKNGIWVSADKIQGNNNHITFKNIPTGTIYRIKRDSIAERIFMYEDGIVDWH